MRSVAVFLALAAAASAGGPGERLAREAAKAEKNGQIVQAYLLWAQAAAAEPGNPAYWTHAQSLKTPASLLSEKRLPALGEEIKEAPEAPITTPPITARDLQDLDQMAAIPRLTPFRGKKDFHLRGDAKTLFEQMAAAFGYTVIFEKDYGASQQTIVFNVTDVDYEAGLHALEQATNSFIVPLSGKVMLVAQDNPTKRTELEPNEAMAIPIPQRTSIQEAQELSVMVQQSLEIRRLALDSAKRLIFMRDRASKIELASAILSQLSGGKPQVSVDIDFVSIAASSSLSLGLSTPTSFPLVDFGRGIFHSTYSIPAGFARFLSFGAGRTFMGIGLADAQMFATATRTEGVTLLSAQINASDGQPATMHIGDKYPIVTAAYLGSGGLRGGTSTTFAAISTASYPDIGLTGVSLTGKMKLVVNGKSFPFTIPTGANSLIGLENIINASGLGVGATTIQRGTEGRPYTMLVVANTLGINSIQLFDDPDGDNVELLKSSGDPSSISTTQFADRDTIKVSTTGLLSLAVGEETFPLALARVTNNLNGLRDAVNQSGAAVRADVIATGSASTPYMLQVVDNQDISEVIQIFDDPDGANTPLLASTDQINATTGALGKTVATGATNYGQTYSPPPTFNFEDLGLVMKITPFVHDLDEVTLEVEAEFKVLGSGSYNGVPVISTRKFQGKVRLRTSEYAIVMGLMSETQARTVSGLAGLSDIPVLGALFRQNTKTRDTSQVLLVIKPRVTSLPASEFATKTFWFGAEMKPRTLL